MKKIFNILTLAVFFTITLTNCKKERADSSTSLPTIVNVSGIVTDANGYALSNVEVTIGSLSTISDSNGNYSFAEVSPSRKYVAVTFYQLGYFKVTRTSFITPTVEINAIMTRSDASISNSTMFQSSNGVTINTMDGSSVTIPANSFLDSVGVQYTGPIVVNMLYLDPTNYYFHNLIDGGEEMYDNYGRKLEAFGYIQVELFDAQGNPIHFDASLTAKSVSSIEMSIPSTLLAYAPESIGLYSFNDNIASYALEGTATKGNGTYAGTTAHFSSWTCARVLVPPPTIGLNKFTLNGGGYNNQIFTDFYYNSVDIISDTVETTTRITLSSNMGEAFFHLAGVDRTGSYSLNENRYISLYLYSEKNTNSSPEFYSGSVEITKYGNVGELIEGKYNGYSSNNSTSIYLTDGYFSVIRGGGVVK